MTNAPYYQMRAGQFSAAPNSTNAVPSQFEHQNDEYDPSRTAECSEHSAPSCQPSTDTPANTLEENHNLVELLEAATTAADQTAQVMPADELAAAAQNRSKRKKVSDLAAAPASPDGGDELTAKRRRVHVPTDPQLQTINPAIENTPQSTNLPPSGESLLNDARAAGVHSAAALFRRSSEKTSRKYTRPPMSKLFISLQLTPENFLHLQAQAKLYMLDPAHPERQNCVGNRGKGDTDMVKLRLFNCVREFLNNGLGEHFFGEHAEAPGEMESLDAARALGEERTGSAEGRLIWPRDGNKIISLVTPLMRRMVTNERQRVYAIETRKGGAKKDKEGSVEAVQLMGNEDQSGSVNIEQQLQAAFDPSLVQPQSRLQSLQSASPSSQTPVTSSQVYYAHTPTTPSQKQPTSEGALRTRSDLNEDQPLALPVDGPADPYLNHINIFLTLAPQGLKQGSKLGEKRISAEQSNHLAWYNYSDFLNEIIHLIETACTKYPGLQAKSLSHSEHLDGEPGPSNENLRGLAVAANALQSEAADPDARAPSEIATHLAPKSAHDQATARESLLGQGTGPSPSAGTQSSTPPHRVGESGSCIDHPKPSELLSRCTVKTIGPDGWKIVGNAEDWYHVLTERAFAVWADGVCNIIIELQAVPAGPDKVRAGDEKIGAAV